jgi:hypothetical protein
MGKVSIKILADPTNPQMSMKYVGAREYISPGRGDDGKTITGLDELSVDVMRIEDPVEKKKVQAAIKKEREDLEKLLGRDLGVNSEYWNDFFVVLDEELELDPENPMHRLLKTYLIANKKVAPSEDAIYTDESFNNCVFYFYHEDEELDKKAAKDLDKDRAVSKLVIIAEENPRKLLTVYSYLFGYTADNDVKANAAYLKIKELLDVTDKKQLAKNVKNVLEALNKAPEEMTTKLVLDKAVKKKIITSKGNIYRRGEIILGNNYDEALAYLLSFENSAEMGSLKKEVDKT